MINKILVAKIECLLYMNNNQQNKKKILLVISLKERASFVLTLFDYSCFFDVSVLSASNSSNSSQS